MPHRVDAAVNPVESSSPDSELDHPPSHPGRIELGKSDHSVLAAGDGRDDPIRLRDGAKSTHTAG